MSTLRKVDAINTFIDRKNAYDKIRWYKSLVGKLIYAILGTRPDIIYIVLILGQHTIALNSAHMTAAKRTLWYLQHTRNFSLRSRGTNIDTNKGTNDIKNKLIAYSDFNWASVIG